MNKHKILVVEDDSAIRNLITITLETQGYQFLTAKTGSAAIFEAASHKPDIIILDLGLPDMDGVDIIKKVRTWSNMPIIVVSARDADKDKICALDSGADDYLTKPFSVEELLARLRVSQRRIQYENSNSEKNGSVFKNGGLTIDYAAGCVYVDEKEVHLTPIEYKLLYLLSINVGKVLTHKYLIKEVWGSLVSSETPSLRVFMATLRKKIEPAPSQPRYIQTHISVGYRMLRVGDDSAQ